MSTKGDMKKQEILAFINQYTDENGFPPSIRDICRNLKIKSTASAAYYIDKLTEEGLLIKSPGKNRSVKIRKEGTTSIPLIGVVTAGKPIFAYENYEDYFSFPAGTFPGDEFFMLHVEGNSMINAGIFSGDMIVVRKQSVADDGNIVVALLEDSATIKRFFKKESYYILHPENETMEDIVADSVEILGIVVGLIRNLC